jgi:hypothetical protein
MNIRALFGWALTAFLVAITPTMAFAEPYLHRFALNCSPPSPYTGCFGQLLSSADKVQSLVCVVFGTSYAYGAITEFNLNNLVSGNVFVDRRYVYPVSPANWAFFGRPRPFIFVVDFSKSPMAGPQWAAYFNVRDGSSGTCDAWYDL